ncbi:MAG TPA: hypothetical protein VGF80_07895 [Galbitalea sp.]|jgi:hypothetical protein
MTAVSTASTRQPRRVALLGVAGVLIVISALALAIKQAFGLVLEYQTLYSPSDGNGFGDLLPLFFLVALEAGPLIVAFVLLAVWARRALPSAVLLILAIAIPVGYVAEPTELGNTVDFVHVIFAVLAGVFVLAGGFLGRRAGVLFLVAMLLFAFQVVSDITQIFAGTLWGGAVAGFVLAAGYAAFGVALILRWRSISRS